MAAQIIKKVAGYISHDGESDLEEQARKRLFSVFILILGIPLFFVGVNHFAAGFHKYGIINMAFSLAMLAFLPVIKRVSKGIVLYRIISFMFWLLLFYWVATMAMNGFASIWVMVYPIFAFFLLGKKEGFVWSGTLIIVCAVFFFSPFRIGSEFTYPPLFTTRHFGALLFVFFLTYFYESVRIKYKSALDRDRKELQVHRDNLELLVDQRTEEIQRKNAELEDAFEKLQEATDQYRKSQIEKEKIQQQLAHSQKMEAVGTLAGGLAHDFNNLLGGIIGSFNLIDEHLRDEKLKRREEIQEYLNLGMESSKKSSRIIKQLLTLSRRQEFAMTPMDINDSLRNIHSICKNSFPKSIGLDFRFTQDPVMVMVEPVYIEQVLLNLCINAAHAMTTMRREEEPKGGTLTIVPEVVPRGEPLPAGVPEPIGRGAWARIRVIDTGVGIPGESRARIFEPFFTTKKDQGGSGLGLATSYGIIKQHGGFLYVESEENRGSTFSVCLPLSENQSRVEQASPARQEPVELPAPGTVLVIDDETFILDVVRGFLEMRGWKALTASSPERGVALFREHRKEILAVLLDLSMPGKSGIDVFGELKAITPEVRVVLCTGLIDNEVQDLALSSGIKKILNKPFDAESMFGTLYSVLKK